jgi:AraC-like DNA-binding protein
LLETDLTVNEVAGTSGFSEPRELTINFRKWIGLTPTAYRNQFRLR